MNEADPQIVRKAQEEYKRKRSDTLKRLSYRLKKSIDENNGIVNEDMLQQEVHNLRRLQLKRSLYSCNINEIQGFIVGGISSRFWLLRKHINMMTPKEIEKIPFYSWECITIMLENQELHLVIKHEKMMDMFIKFLIHSINTVDGYKNSATKIKETLVY